MTYSAPGWRPCTARYFRTPRHIAALQTALGVALGLALSIGCIHAGMREPPSSHSHSHQ